MVSILTGLHSGAVIPGGDPSMEGRSTIIATGYMHLAFMDVRSTAADKVKHAVSGAVIPGATRVWRGEAQSLCMAINMPRYDHICDA